MICMNLGAIARPNPILVIAFDFVFPNDGLVPHKLGTDVHLEICLSDV